MSMPFPGARLLSVRRTVHATRPVVGLVACLVALGGCGDAPRATAADAGAPRPPAESVSASTPAAVSPPAAIEPAPSSEPPAPVPAAAAPSHRSLDDLVAAARRLHPTARAVEAARRAAEARSVQAGAWANPDVELSYGRGRARVAEAPGDHPVSVSVSQRLEWWSKRRARVLAAEADAVATQADAASTFLALEVDVRLAAIAYATAQAMATQAASQAELAKHLGEVVAKRQAAGDIDLGAAARVRVEASVARVKQQAAERQVATALGIVRAWCGEDLPADLNVPDALGEAPDSATGSAAQADLHPHVRAARAAEQAAQAHTDAERQARIPDVTIGVFGEREWDMDTLGVTLGVEIPLWNRNAGGIAAAEAERDRLSAARRGEELRVQRERTEALGAWETARAEVASLRDDALPAAEEAVRLRTTGFGIGDVSLAEVLDARRALLGVQTDLLDARRRLAEAHVRLLAATGSRP